MVAHLSERRAVEDDGIKKIMPEAILSKQSRQTPSLIVFLYQLLALTLLLSSFAPPFPFPPFLPFSLFTFLSAPPIPSSLFTVAGSRFLSEITIVPRDSRLGSYTT